MACRTVATNCRSRSGSAEFLDGGSLRRRNGTDTTVGTRAPHDGGRSLRRSADIGLRPLHAEIVISWRASTDRPRPATPLASPGPGWKEGPPRLSWSSCLIDGRLRRTVLGAG